MTEDLNQAISLGRDYAGTVEFHDLTRAVMSGRFKILLLEKQPNAGPDMYRVVLQAEW